MSSSPTPHPAPDERARTAPSTSGPRLSRRTFLAGVVATAGACSSDDSGDAAATDRAPVVTQDATATPAPAPTPTATPPPVVDLPADPFTLGVASGDPTPTSVILWTRLAPEPSAGGGMPDEDVPVTWEISADESFAEPVATGTETAVAGLAHSVHVDAARLEPDTQYWYRFRVGPYTSTAGRTRTLPDPGSSPGALRLAFGSCQHYEAGYYAAHRHLAAEDVDLFFWLGDYIYEYGPGEFPIESASGEVRLHDSPEVTDLAAYRNRYALYKQDADLQAHHGARPWLVTWDDHEVDNDYAGSASEDGAEPTSFDQRRAAAYQAWYEHMPVRLAPPDGAEYPIYRTLGWGTLAAFFVLDGRQHRSDQPDDGEFIPIGGLGEDAPLRTLSPIALDPDHTFLGTEQETWLIEGLSASPATWNVVAQQVIMHGISVLPGQDPPLVVTDTWDGYYGNRKRILETLAGNGVENLVVLTGDFHSASVGDLKPDPFDVASPVVGTEFMATSISSAFPVQVADLAPLVLSFNPQIKFFDTRNGYTRLRADTRRARGRLQGPHRRLGPVERDRGRGHVHRHRRGPRRRGGLSRPRQPATSSTVRMPRAARRWSNPELISVRSRRWLIMLSRSR